MSKIAIITGGASGIGFATAEKFISLNYKVLIASRNIKKLKLAKEQLSAKFNNAQIEYMQCDVALEHKVIELFAKCKNIYGTPDILINSAAIIAKENFINFTLNSWQEIIDINLKGTILCCYQAFKIMQKKGGVIINISSLGGIQNFTKFPGYSSYVTSKAAITGLTEALAIEGKNLNIRVNAVAPGAVATTMLKKADPNLKTNTTAQDIANSISYLCDDKLAKHINGTILTINSNE
ncbi:MAG: SDR family NAD(P)-dependent oxidoreductase [Rickettsiales bacterium]